MKRILCLLLTLSLSLLCACGKKDAAEQTPAPASTPAPQLTIPQTGDTFPVALLVVVVFGSIAAIGVLTYKRRKSEADTEEDDQ